MKTSPSKPIHEGDQVRGARELVETPQPGADIRDDESDTLQRPLPDFTLRDIARISKLQEQLDKAFGGLTLDPKDLTNVRLFKLQLHLQSELLAKKSEALHLHSRALELSRSVSDGPEQPLVMNEALAQEVMRVVVEGECTIDDLIMAKALRAKAKAYNTSLPADLKPFVPDTTAEDLATAKDFALRLNKPGAKRNRRAD